MFLTPEQKQAILDRLNEPELIAAFIELNETHDDRHRFIDGECEPCDTSYSPFRKAHTTWLDEQLEKLEREQDLHKERWPRDAKLNPLIRSTDFYFFSGTSGKEPRYDREWLDRIELPFAAYKIFDSVFNFSFSDRRWSARPWLGVKEDPLMRMPYSRKYDWERVEYAEWKEKRDWERVSRAIDLIKLLQKRVSDFDLQLTEGSFEMPDYEDIAEEMARDDLAIAPCMILGMGGKVHYDLWELEDNTFPVKPLKERQSKPGPSICGGAYEGALNQLRHPSGASLKQMVLDALEALVEACYVVTYTPYEERWDELEEAKEQVREALGLPSQRDPDDA